MKNIKLTREPVLEGTILSVVGYLVAILVVAGVVGSETETALLNVAAALAPAAAVLLNLALGLIARRQVTPMASPRTMEGEEAMIVPLKMLEEGEV